mmetsp:Transcript_30242/g.89754  ORF Transcript_30242/g.89754 Transcript_30242/m.89754 type:complete len:201 (-) Transcript_30242:2394-2996(-)|eukprot:365378-Chlamydomonas_euryale.AAC.13
MLAMCAERSPFVHHVGQEQQAQDCQDRNLFHFEHSHWEACLMASCNFNLWAHEYRSLAAGCKSPTCLVHVSESETLCAADATTCICIRFCAGSWNPSIPLDMECSVSLGKRSQALPCTCLHLGRVSLSACSQEPTLQTQTKPVPLNVLTLLSRLSDSNSDCCRGSTGCHWECNVQLPRASGSCKGRHQATSMLDGPAHMY